MQIKHLFKLLFHWQSLILLPAFYFLSFTVISVFEYNIQEEDLIPHSGKVVFIDTFNAINQKDRLKYGKGHSLILKIDSEPKSIFKIGFTPKSTYFNFIRSQVNLNDTITIFSNPRILGARESDIIEKLLKGESVIVRYSENISKRVATTFLMISFPLFAGFFILYFLLLRQRNARMLKH